MTDAEYCGVLRYRLWELRKERRFTQKYVAAESGLGEKTISAIETGAKTAALRVLDLKRILGVYGITLEQFFAEVQP